MKWTWQVLQHLWPELASSGIFCGFFYWKREDFFDSLTHLHILLQTISHGFSYGYPISLLLMGYRDHIRPEVGKISPVRIISIQRVSNFETYNYLTKTYVYTYVGKFQKQNFARFVRVRFVQKEKYSAAWRNAQTQVEATVHDRFSIKFKSDFSEELLRKFAAECFPGEVHT